MSKDTAAWVKGLAAADAACLKAFVEDVKDRIRAAKASERDHKSNAPVIRRELAGYTRGLNDALYSFELAIDGWSRRGRVK
jgi:hypothetical protein